jgi:hypothetical protein
LQHHHLARHLRKNKMNVGPSQHHLKSQLKMLDFLINRKLDVKMPSLV